MIEQERIQAFWEKCGFEKKGEHWEISGSMLHYYELPPIDLKHIGLLFEHAVPLVEKIGLSGSDGYYHAVACKGNRLESASWSYNIDNKDLAEALFLALEQVL